MKLTLSQALERTVTILLGNTDQDGASAADYSGVPASVSFPATVRGKTFTLGPPRIRWTTMWSR